MFLDFAAGCLGGCAGIMVGYPLDTIKVHLQTQNSRNAKYKGTWHCFRAILARDSVAGLYRGMSSPMAGVALVNAIVFGVYGQTHRRLTEQDSLQSYFLAGASAGLAQTPVCSPIELAKTRLQLQSRDKFSSPLQCLRDIYRKEGYRGLFNGMGVTFLREAPSYGIYFLTYEALTRSILQTPISTLQMILAGGLAGTASWVITYPLDVVKSRLQAETNRFRYSGAIDCFRQSVQAEGYSCLFRGLNSTIIRAFPTNAATFVVVNWTFRIFDKQTDSSTRAKVKLTKVGELSSGSKDESLFQRWNAFVVDVWDDDNRSLGSSSYSTLSMISLNGPLLGVSTSNFLRKSDGNEFGIDRAKSIGLEKARLVNRSKKLEVERFVTTEKCLRAFASSVKSKDNVRFSQQKQEERDRPKVLDKTLEKDLKRTVLVKIDQLQ